MALPPAGYAECTMKFHVAGDSRVAMCVFGVDNGPDLGPDLIATNVWDDWDESLRGIQIDSLQILGCRVVNYDGTFYEDPRTAFGAIANDAMPPQVAYLLHKNTGLVGRENQGRMYVPGVGEDKANAVGFVDPTFRASIQTAANAFLAKLTADGYPMVILHDSPGVSAVVTTLTCDVKVATQRRRLR